MKDQQNSTGLHAWMTAKPGRRLLVAAVLFVVGMTVFFAAWFGLAILFGDREDGGALALNTVLVGFCAFVLLPVLHRGMLCGFWHHAREGEAGRTPGSFQLGANVASPHADVRWPWLLRLRHTVLYVLGMALVLFVFLPLDNQRAFASWVSRFSVSPAFAGQLNLLLFAWLPLLVLMALCMLLLYRQVRRRDAGLLDEADKRLLNAEMSWLFAFAGALAATMLVCRLAGAVVGV
ncbi:MAG TPA: hypothetical protein DCP40_10720 [Stenotrophomonas sp.]|nr:hypothetical protein [Stenotrophomonas sp.]